MFIRPSYSYFCITDCHISIKIERLFSRTNLVLRNLREKNTLREINLRVFFCFYMNTTSDFITFCVISTSCKDLTSFDHAIVRVYKKLSYCWETVRRESMLSQPRIAEMDVEMTT